jgi:ATP-dependent helicase/nuclease subunit A
LRLWLAHHGDAADGWFLFRELDDSELAVEPTARSQTENGQNAPDLDDKAFERLCNALKWEYPFRLSTQRTAKTSVTALRRQADEELEVEAERLFIPRWQGTPRRTVDLDLSAADVGKAHHKFLEHIALAESASLAGLKSEAERLVGEGSLTAEEFAALNFAALESFWRSEIGKRICANAAHVQRELPFTARFTPGELDLIVKGTVQPDASDGFVIVQGVADLVVLLPKEIWLLDFKTDDVTPSEVAAKEKFYAPQLQLYTLALERIYGRRVSNSWLHFLSCDKTLTVLSPAQIPAD